MRWLRRGFLPASLAILAAAALTVPLPMYRESPGRIVSLGACVEINHDDVSDVDGDFLLMTISVLPTTLVDAVTAVADPETRVVWQRNVIPPGVDTRQFFRQQRRVFAERAEIGAAVGLEAAGLDATVTGDGVRVVQVLGESPADGLLRPGDVITAAGDREIMIDEDLRAVIADHPLGEPIDFTVTREGETVQIAVAPVEMEGMPLIGIVPDTINPRVDLPVPVDVASGSVGGPSAGLMIALTVYDKVLPDLDLAAGRIVAGTGTVDPAGRVGPVGGAGLKVIAAERIKADVFLAPAANLAEAQAAVPEGSPLQVIPVQTFEDAAEALSQAPAAPPRDSDWDPDECPFGDRA